MIGGDNMDWKKFNIYCMARRGMARPGLAWHGSARQGI